MTKLMFVPRCPISCQFVAEVFQSPFWAPLQIRSKADPETVITSALLVELNA